MNYFILVIVAIALGAYFGRSGLSGGLIAKQAKRKRENQRKIMEFLREKGKIQNNDVERLVGVSNATAERYLDELEKEGKLTQNGKIGQNVFYTLK